MSCSGWSCDEWCLDHFNIPAAAVQHLLSTCTYSNFSCLPRLASGVGPIVTAHRHLTRIMKTRWNKIGTFTVIYTITSWTSTHQPGMVARTNTPSYEIGTIPYHMMKYHPDVVVPVMGREGRPDLPHPTLHTPHTPHPFSIASVSTFY